MSAIPITSCQHVLLRGENKGKRCPFNKKVGHDFCGRHVPKKKCSICMETIKKNNSCTLECGHDFHLECIFELYRQNAEFNNKCPLCRKNYTAKINNRNYRPRVEYILMRNVNVPRQDEPPQDPAPAVAPLNIDQIPPPGPLLRHGLGPGEIPPIGDDDIPNIEEPLQFLARFFDFDIVE